MIGLWQESVCFWSFTKDPRYAAPTCFHSTPLLAVSMGHSWRMNGWVGVIFILFLWTAYKTQSLEVHSAWYVAVETWCWLVLQQPAMGMGTNPLQGELQSLSLHLPPLSAISIGMSSICPILQKGERPQWPAKLIQLVRAAFGPGSDQTKKWL